jgi:ribosomal protein S18 acetylase RimI-like enzyme
MSAGPLELIEQSAAFLPRYALISVAFAVRERLKMESPGVSNVGLPSEAVEPSYEKDYDALPGQRPTDWPKRFDLSKWWFAAAYLAEQYVGGVAVVMDAADEALLWDIRIAPQYRRQGIGRRLLKFAEDRARAAGKQRINVETQNINVAACRFYATAGYKLRSIDRFAYPELPNDVQLIWTKQLSDSDGNRFR